MAKIKKPTAIKLPPILTGKKYVIAALKITPLKKIWQILKQKRECEQLIFKSDNLASVWPGFKWFTPRKKNILNILSYLYLSSFYLFWISRNVFTSYVLKLYIIYTLNVMI